MIAVRALPPPTDWAQTVDTSRSSAVEVIPLYDERPWLLTAADSVARLATLPDNWDGARSPKVKPEIITKAVEVLYRFAVEPMSHACPVPGGGLQLEWESPARYLEIEVLPDGSLEYFTQKTGEAPKEGPLSLTDASTMRELFGYLSRR